MLKKRIYQCLGAASLALAVGACKTPELVVKNESRNTPASYATASPGHPGQHQHRPACSGSSFSPTPTWRR